MTDAITKAVKEAVAQQYPASWLKHPNVTSLPATYPVHIELPIETIREALKAIEADAEAERNQMRLWGV